jgi:hypothetical protein
LRQALAIGPDGSVVSAAVLVPGQVATLPRVDTLFHGNPVTTTIPLGACFDFEAGAIAAPSSTCDIRWDAPGAPIYWQTVSEGAGDARSRVAFFSKGFDEVSGIDLIAAPFCISPENSPPLDQAAVGCSGSADLSPSGPIRTAVVRTDTQGVDGDKFYETFSPGGSNGNYYVVGNVSFAGGQVTFSYKPIAVYQESVDYYNGPEETSVGTFNSDDLLVRKLNAVGAPVWTLQTHAGGDGTEFTRATATSIAVDSTGNVFVLVTIGGHLSVLGSLYKLDGATGEVLWETDVFGYLRAVAVNADGDAFVTGSLYNPGDSSEIPAVDADYRTANLTKYSGETGEELWTTAISHTVDPDSLTQALQVQIDRSGNIVIGGLFSGIVDLGAGPFNSQGSGDLFLAGYTPDGGFAWAKQIPITLNGSFTGMGIGQDGLDDGGRVTIGGVFHGSMVADGSFIVNSIPELTQHQDLFLTSFVAPCMASGCDVQPPIVGVDPADQNFVTLQTDIVLQATSPGGTSAWFALPTSSDAQSGGAYAVCDPPPSSTFPVGTTTVSCVGFDARGNQSAPSTFTVTVLDSAPPLISASIGSVTANATGPGGAVVEWTLPTAYDQVSGVLPVTCDPPSGSLFPVGTTTVVCSATDGSGNVGGAPLEVTVRPAADATPPVWSGVPANQLLEATSAAGASATFALPIATDAIDGPRPVTCSHASGSTFAIGTSTVTCTAADSAGNGASTSFGVTVQDTTPPAIAVPAPISVAATSSAGAVVSYSASASELVWLRVEFS